MRVAIVGSRDYPDREAVEAFVSELPPGTTVVSGGARGVDSWAVAAARKRTSALDVRVWPAEWERFGKRAGYLRNAKIVQDSDRVVAFWDGQSRGTKHTIDLAREAGKPVEIIPPRKVVG